MICCKNKTQLVQSVGHLIRHSNPDLPLTMIITRGKSEGFCVSDATSSGWDAVEKLMSEHFSKLSHT